MSWPLIAIAVTFVSLLVATVRDWRDHDTRKRRFSVGLSLLGLLSAVASGVGAVKSDRDADKTTREMAALREQLEIVNRKASLAVTFPVKEWSDVPRKVLVMPFQSAVSIALSLYNPSRNWAKAGRAVIQLPDGCTFSHEAPGLMDNGVANQREYVFDALDGGVMLKPITFDVNVPRYSEPGVGIVVKAACENCDQSDRDYLLIRWDSARQTPWAL